MKTPVTIICANESSCLETVALRGTLEYFGCAVTVHWIGNSQQFKEVLQGKIPMQPIVVLSSHGCEDGFYGYENEVLNIEEMKINLPGTTVISLGCMTGTEKFAWGFIAGKANTYIAPPDYPEGNSALIFATIFFWKLLAGQDVLTAWKKASSLFSGEDRFHLYQHSTSGMRVDDTKDIPL